MGFSGICSGKELCRADATDSTGYRYAYFPDAGPNSSLVCRKLFFQAANSMKAVAKGPGDSWPQPEKITMLHGELCWKRNVRFLIAC